MLKNILIKHLIKLIYCVNVQELMIILCDNLNLLDITSSCDVYFLELYVHKGQIILNSEKYVLGHKKNEKYHIGNSPFTHLL